MLARCPGCGAALPVLDGPTHRYLESSAACWAMYGEVLAREYEHCEYFAVHALTVDAYAVQHPGRPSPQTIQSVAVHLISLCLMLEHGVAIERALDARRAALAVEPQYVWLEPPASLGALTIADVHPATSASDHARRVREWANGAWAAWRPHHATIARWLPKTFTGRTA
jgi:hypothetical protein